MAEQRTIVVPADAKFVSGAVIRPGDKLVLGYAMPLSAYHADVIKARFAEILPDVEIVLVDQITSMAVYRPDEAADGAKPEMSDAEFDRRLRLWIRINPQEWRAYLAKQARIERSNRPIRL